MAAKTILVDQLNVIGHLFNIAMAPENARRDTHNKEVLARRAELDIKVTHLVQQAMAQVEKTGSCEIDPINLTLQE
jgi:hypothetical protein